MQFTCSKQFFSQMVDSKNKILIFGKSNKLFLAEFGSHLRLERCVITSTLGGILYLTHNASVYYQSNRMKYENFQAYHHQLCKRAIMHYKLFCFSGFSSKRSFFISPHFVAGVGCSISGCCQRRLPKRPCFKVRCIAHF